MSCEHCGAEFRDGGSTTHWPMECIGVLRSRVAALEKIVASLDGDCQTCDRLNERLAAWKPVVKEVLAQLGNDEEQVEVDLYRLEVLAAGIPPEHRPEVEP